MLALAPPAVLLVVLSVLRVAAWADVRGSAFWTTFSVLFATAIVFLLDAHRMPSGVKPRPDEFARRRVARDQPLSLGPRYDLSMRRCAFVASVLASALLAQPALAEPAISPAASTATARYQKSLGEAHTRRRVNVEQLFLLAVAAGKEIEAGISAADEALAAGHEARPTITALEGLVISSEEAIYARPDPSFFASLAQKKGGPADRAFFRLLIATRPHGVWPAYIAQQTDVTGCALFDLPELPSIYAGWLDFRRRFPGAYVGRLLEELEAMDQELLGDCACGTRETVIAGLEAFLKALPEAPVAARIRARLDELRAGQAEFRPECRSG